MRSFDIIKIMGFLLALAVMTVTFQVASSEAQKVQKIQIRAGQNFTQAQVDMADFKNIDYRVGYLGAEMQKDTLILWMAQLIIIQSPEGYYIVQPHQYPIIFEIQSIVDCLNRFTKAACISGIRQKTIQEAINYRDSLIVEFETYKTKVTQSQIRPEDFTFTSQELNP